MNISGFLPVYNQIRDALVCIRSLMATELKHLLIIDDGMTDKIGAQILDQMSHDYEGRIEVIHQDHRGLHKTWNHGMEILAPCSDWILLMGSDAELTQADALTLWMEDIIRLDKEHNCNIGACHATLYSNPYHVQFAGSLDGSIEGESHATCISGQTFKDAVIETRLAPWVTHTAVMLQSYAMTEVNAHHGSYYDDRYLLWCGDRVLSYQMRELGYDLGISSRVRVMHHDGGSKTIHSLYNNEDKAALYWLDRYRLERDWEQVMYKCER